MSEPRDIVERRDAQDEESVTTRLIVALRRRNDTLDAAAAAELERLRDLVRQRIGLLVVQCDSFKRRAEKAESALATAEAAGVERAAWQSIATAPKDREILVWIAGTGARPAEWDRSADAWVSPESGVTYDERYTPHFWRPRLPGPGSSSVKSEVEGLRAAVVEAARLLIAEGCNAGRDSHHGWEMDGERAYLCDACAFDALSESVAALSQAGSANR